jgi:hypothetical protein
MKVGFRTFQRLKSFMHSVISSNEADTIPSPCFYFKSLPLPSLPPSLPISPRTMTMWKGEAVNF